MNLIKHLFGRFSFVEISFRYENPEVLKRLDVRIFEASPGDSGWEVFSLDYNVTAPLNVIITTNAMDK